MVVGFLRWFSGSLASSKSKWCSARQVWRWQCPPSGEAMFSHWFRPTTDGDGPDKDEEEMPPAQELEEEFEVLLTKVTISEQRRKEMAALAPERKWKIILAARAEAKNRAGNILRPGHYIELLDNPCGPSLPDMNDVQSAIANSTKTWLTAFINIGGIDSLSNVLEMLNENEDKTEEEMELLGQCLLCVKTIMNSQQGLHSIIEHPDILSQVLLFFSFEMEVATSVQVLQLLAVAAVSSCEGYRNVLNAFDQCKIVRRERVRFQTLVDALFSDSPDDEDVELYTATVTFINALINASLHLEERMEVRNDLMYLGLPDAIKDLNFLIQTDQNPSPTVRKHVGELETQLEVFSEVMRLDSDENKRAGIDITNPEDLFQSIAGQALEFGMGREFLSVLQHLMVIPNEPVYGSQLWEALESAVHQVPTHSPSLLL